MGRAMLSKKFLFTGLLTLLYVGVITRLIDWHSFSLTMTKISKETIVVVLLLVVFANLVAYVRARSVIRVLGFSPGWRSMFLAYASGNITNLSLNVVGQSLTRAVVLSENGVPSGVSVIATYIERILAAGILFFFSLMSLWYLFGHVTIDLDHGIGKVLLTSAAILLVSTIVALTIFREQLGRYGRMASSRLLHFWDAALLTVTGHAAGIGAYIVLLQVMGQQGVTMPLIAALTIVLFVSSLPISFSGFGIRELSAAGTLSVVGVPADVAVAAALIIGILYFVVTGAFGLTGLAMVAHRKSLVFGAAAAGGGAPAPNPMNSAPSSATGEIAQLQNWDETIVKICAAACAVLLFFRI